VSHIVNTQLGAHPGAGHFSASLPWWRKARSLKIEIALAFGVVIALMLALGFAFYLGDQRSAFAIDKLLNSDGRMADLSLRSAQAMLKARVAESDFLLSVDRLGADEARERYVSPMQSHLLDMHEYLTSVRIISSDPSFREKIRRIEQQAQQYEDGFLAFVDLYGKPDQVDVASKTQQDYIAAALATEPLLEELHTTATKLALRTQSGVESAAIVTRWTLVVTVAVATILGAVVALILSRRITGSVTQLITFSTRVAAGDFSARAEQAGVHEFAILAHAMNQMAESVEKSHVQRDAALNNMLQGLCMFDKDTRLVLCNDRFVQMYGLSRETVKPGITFLDLLRHREEIGSLAEDPEQLYANVLGLTGQGKAGVFTDEATDGRVTQILTQPVPGGGWVATYEDITARRRAEQALAQAQGELEQAEREARAAHTLLRDAFEAVPEGLVLFDAEDRYVLWNHRYAELYALGTSHICVGMRFADVLRRGIAMGRFPEAAGREDEWIADRLARHAEVYSSHEQELPDGRWLRVEERRTADGGSIGVRIDITELKQREASFRMLFESNPLPMFVWDLETMGFLAVNDAAIDHYGYTREQFAGMTVVDIRPVEERASFLNRARSFPSYYHAEGLRQYKADGSLFEADIYSRALSYNGRSARFAAVIDMTERRAAERERDRSRVFLDQIIDNIPVTIVVKDAVECRFVLINRAGENLLGLDRATVLGKTAQELFPKEQAEMIALHDQQVLVADGPIIFGEHRNIARDNDNRIVTTTRLAIRDADGNAQYMISVIEDVTERKAIEQQLQQAQKMEMVGSLTGGVAHDFNNLLTIMIGNLDLLQLDLADNAPAEHKVETILQAALRGSDLTRQMLAFSRRQPLQPRRVHVNELIGDTTRLLVRTLGENITVDLRTAADLWPTLVDGSQLEAALVNIAINARDAMPDGGTLIIETRNMQLDADYAAHHLEVTPGDYVRIEITDSGTGMPPDVLARVFEPFFTTKEPGKGTGLGLSMVYGFIKQSGGHVNLYSEVGRGTTFKLYLPRAAGEIRSAVESEIQAPQPAVLGEVVLVVDDNPDVRATVVSQLRSFGYRILEADSATTALETIDRGAHIDLMFTDVVMPGPMNGKELGQVARLRRPDLKVLFTSGFPGTFLNRDSDLDVGGVLLSKPYRKDDLAKAVRDLLHQV
jgi:PAS domain S-box-containing protein